MKSKKSSLRAALFLALIGAAFAFNACWQGTPAGGSNMPGSSGNVTSGDTKSGDTNSKNNNSKDNGSKNADGNKSEDTDSKDNNPKDSGGKNSGGGDTASSIEGITWRAENSSLNTKMTLQLNGGNVKATLTAAGQTVPDNGTYTVSGDTIKFTGFTNPTLRVMFKEFKYKVEGDTLTLSDTTTNAPMYQFEKA